MINSGRDKVSSSKLSDFNCDEEPPDEIEED